MARFRILSLDGGGIRGAFTASFLATLEEKLGQPLIEHFDLVAGTSTGGIIATALALRVPPDRISSFYKSEGPRIFRRQPPAKLPSLPGVKGVLLKLFKGKLDAALRSHEMDLDYLLQSKYDAVELQRALKEVFEARTLEKAKTRLVVPAVDLSKGQTVVFKTPHLPGLDRDRHLAATEIVMATAAAPTYFPHACIKQGSAYCDGGMWANNPSMVAYAEAIKIRDCCKRKEDICFEPDEIEMLSIGTGKSSYSFIPPTNQAGLLWWGPRLVDLLMYSQAQGINFQAEYLLGQRLVRVDYPIPEKSWKLDSIDLVDQLTHLGRETAHEQFSTLEAKFFDSPAVVFTPFAK